MPCVAGMNREEEYKYLSQLEIETTKTRHTTFTAILSISFVLPGMAIQATGKSVQIFGRAVDLTGLVFFLGFLFYLFALYHYAWYHRHAHAYRSALKKLEEELGMEVYRLRIRPRLGKMKLHFDWALYIIGLMYGIITLQVVGWLCFLVGCSFILLLYALFLLNSIWRPEEPLEQEKHPSD